jgi:uncharacterized protein
VKFKRPDAIQEMMGKAVRSLPDATAAFVELVAADQDDRPALLDQLHAIETKADERYVKLLRKVTSTFVTPFDREDLYSMIETLDDVIDELDHAGSLIVGFGLGELPEPFRRNAEHLAAMGDRCAEAPALIKKPAKLESLLFEINTIENQLDAGYRQLLIETIVPGADPIHAIRIKTLSDSVELASRGMEEFIHALGITAIKET